MSRQSRGFLGSSSGSWTHTCPNVELKSFKNFKKIHFIQPETEFGYTSQGVFLHWEASYLNQLFCSWSMAHRLWAINEENSKLYECFEERKANPSLSTFEWWEWNYEGFRLLKCFDLLSGNATLSINPELPANLLFSIGESRRVDLAFSAWVR